MFFTCYLLQDERFDQSFMVSCSFANLETDPAPDPQPMLKPAQKPDPEPASPSAESDSKEVLQAEVAAAPLMSELNPI